MKIKAYFVTYRNNEELEKTLNSFLGSGVQTYSSDLEISIINNSPDYPIKHEILLQAHELGFKIVNNYTRSSNSTGHLARNWNECLIDGFKDIDNPDCDIVMLSQNDNMFHKDTIHRIIESHQTYSFIQNGHGDSFHSYTPEAIKKVGLWDERFCGIGYQEADYFLRQLIYNSQGCSIKDTMHERWNNRLDYDIVDYDKGGGFSRRDVEHLRSMAFHNNCEKVFELKWPYMQTSGWTGETAAHALHHGRQKQFMMYPYFEEAFAKNGNYFSYE